MSYLQMPKGAALQFFYNSTWNRMSEHNRSSINVTPIRIEQSKRTANGTLRSFFVADKKSFNISWTMIPSYSTETVDGWWGAQDLKTFYESSTGKGAFNIRLNFAKDGTNQEVTNVEAYTVKFTDCSFSVVKRGVQAFWDVSITLEQI